MNGYEEEDFWVSNEYNETLIKIMNITISMIQAKTKSVLTPEQIKTLFDDLHECATQPCEVIE